MSSTNSQTISEAETFWSCYDDSAQIHPSSLYRYQIIEKIIKNFNKPTHSILDLGCGNGALLAHFKKYGVGQLLIGVDGAISIIEKNKKQWPFAKFYQADLQKTADFPFHDQVDLIVCSEVIEHMPHDRAVFGIAYQQLKPGGYFILTTPGGKRRRYDREFLGHLRHYEIDKLARDVASFGFKIIRQQKCGWPIFELQKIISSLFMKRVAKELASPEGQTLFFKVGCKMIEWGLSVSSKCRGMQLVIVAQKPFN